MQSKVELLYEKYSILKLLNEKYNNEIEKNLTYKVVKAGEYFKTGYENCAGFIFLISGEIKVYKISKEGNTTNLFNIKAGEICHEALSCFINEDSLNIEAKAIYDTEIFIIHRELFKRYFLKDIDFMNFLYKNLYYKFKSVIENKEELIHESLEERLLKHLKSYNSNVIYTTHKDIALEISSSREVVSRKLKKLEKEGIVSLKRGKIYML